MINPKDILIKKVFLNIDGVVFMTGQAYLLSFGRSAEAWKLQVIRKEAITLNALSEEGLSSKETWIETSRFEDLDGDFVAVCGGKTEGPNGLIERRSYRANSKNRRT